ncbi:hypothetical protein IQ26_06200 [Mesorhizobium tianshanense]|uniref:Uncharacterized protein n=1 Tax=Mesorhizobium tianshanense TaxID=39844 RepID=A0A562MZN9_9HYPH|nr:hypothetical protein IQ26_06200 [Mesorhizobium tianshanense]
MLYEIARSLGVPVSRLFEGLPGNDENSEPQPLSVESASISLSAQKASG